MKNTGQEGIILGIDPGTRVMGYGVIKTAGREMEVLALGIVKMASIKDPYRRMSHILEKTYELLEEFHPDIMAIEAPFYSKNVQSMLKLGRAQGVAIAAALSKNVPVCEYAPRKIKMAVTGRGAASKEQVAAMLKKILRFTQEPESWDATDALAVAVCHANQTVFHDRQTSSLSWETFISKNPQRIVRK
ncbi:MAG TPA: crossover junction endodeoxyribonuclease RuvC [Bacteroidales bacterium]|nr:MAG: Crossover junction endodeoxyribonuclease RuvC [Bacteroidetes bacterium ADurb.Bin037]HPV87967.1 crossover junction endodeoxyribonuclease RuvC [Bacteroidales bacterium]HPW77793.1 crossover junction endodeoxyribonuclease RuvC [Bacteroidales bacterium]HQB55620.1 crossover junction endodeoxyribonuclease RuvC [Bacteroidales bacterium]